MIILDHEINFNLCHKLLLFYFIVIHTSMKEKKTSICLQFGRIHLLFSVETSQFVFWLRILLLFAFKNRRSWNSQTNMPNLHHWNEDIVDMHKQLLPSQYTWECFLNQNEIVSKFSIVLHLISFVQIMRSGICYHLILLSFSNT